MKKYYIVSIAMLMAGASYAQKLEKPNIDKITGDTTYRTTKEKIYQKIGWGGGETTVIYAYGLKVKDVRMLAIQMEVMNGRNSSVFSIPEGAKAYIKLNDNSIITLTSVLSQVSESRVVYAAGSASTRGSALPMYVIGKSDAEKLKLSPATMIRIETGSGNFDYEIKDKNSIALQKTVELITQI